MSKVKQKGSLLSLPPLVVGLTGGMGSGKSTVGKRLRERGVSVLDADVLVHESLMPGGKGFAPTLKLFGPSVKKTDGTLDRSVLAQRIFERPGLRKKLERILHPLVEKFFKRRIAAHRRGLLVLEVPLLFETGMDRLADRTVFVWAPQKICLARLVASGRFTRAQALRRMKAQMTPAEKRRRAHFLLDNSRSQVFLEKSISRLFDIPPGGGLPIVYKNVTIS